MRNIYVKLYDKIIYLIIITVLPIGIYLYNNEEAQTVFKNSMTKEFDKYIIEGYLDENEKSLYFTQTIAFTNRANYQLDRLFLDTDLNNIELRDLEVNGEKVYFKGIDIDNDKLILLLGKPIDHNETVNLEINYCLKLGHHYEDEGYTIYDFNKWYLDVSHLDGNGWNINYDGDIDGSKDKKHFSIKITLPVNHIIDTDMEIKTSNKISRNYAVYHLQGITYKKIKFSIKEEINY